MARADVKEATRMARMNHELIPAGEGIGPVEVRMAAKRPEWLPPRSPGTEHSVVKPGFRAACRPAQSVGVVLRRSAA